MTIININCDGHAIGGASIAALRIWWAMNRRQMDALFYCIVDASEDGTVLVARSLFFKIVYFFWKGMLKLFFGGIPQIGVVPSGVVGRLNALNPDVVILHAIQYETLSMHEIAHMTSPIVFWYHHDLWPIRGITAHEWYKVPSRLKWLDRLSKWNKRTMAKKMGRRLVPVCASEWVARQIRASGMYAVEPIVIPLPLDGAFVGVATKPRDTVTGRRFCILNGARGGFEVGIKGGDRLLAALDLIPMEERRQMELVVFGESRPDEIRAGVPVRYVGRLSGEPLAAVYNKADVFAFPSRQETFGQTKIESLACGTPVVAFDETACAEGIEHHVTGWIAKANDIEDFARGLRYFYHAWLDGYAVRVPADATARYAPDSVAEQWRHAIEAHL